MKKVIFLSIFLLSATAWSGHKYEPPGVDELNIKGELAACWHKAFIKKKGGEKLFAPTPFLVLLDPSTRSMDPIPEDDYKKSVVVYKDSCDTGYSIRVRNRYGVFQTDKKIRFSCKIDGFTDVRQTNFISQVIANSLGRVRHDRHIPYAMKRAERICNYKGMSKKTKYRKIKKLRSKISQFWERWQRGR